jgi:hypothetical protein
MRIIGLDIHRACAEAVAWQDGKHKRIGRIEMRRSELKHRTERQVQEVSAWAEV